MRWLDKLRLRLRSLFHKSETDKELMGEIEFHLSEQIARNIESGMDLEEARYAAMREFGGLEQIKEECRESRNVKYIENLLQDIRFGGRQLWRAPAFTAVAALTLALGIGANTAVFSVVNGILLRTLPFPDSASLISITDFYPQGAFVAMQSNLRSMDLATYDIVEMNLTRLGEPVRLYGSTVSADFFGVLGIKAALGTTFQHGQDQPGHDDLVILSQSLWRETFDADPSILGRAISLDGVSRRVVGVMPEDFQFPSRKVQFWIPLHFDPNDVGVYWGNFMPVFGRLRPGSNLAQARTEAGMFIPRIRTMFPWKMPTTLWRSISATSLHESIVGKTRTRLLLLLGSIALVLLIACANVANLLLVRAATRQREFAVRSALGASRGRILLQLLIESVLLASLGGALGLLFAFGGLDFLERVLPSDTPRREMIAIDWRVLVFTASLAIVTGILFGLAPAIHASKDAMSETLKSGGRSAIMTRSHRLRDAFAISEIALALLLVVSAGLTMKSLWKLLHVDPGFQPTSIVTARISPSESFCSDFARCVSLYRDLLDHVKGLPGARDSALVNVVPLDGQTAGVPVKVEDYVIPPGGANPFLWENVSTPDYLRLMGIPLLEGRSFTATDGADNAQPVVLVSQSTARRLWPGKNPIGQRLRPPWLKDWRIVVGVVADVREDQLTNRVPDYMAGEIYLPFGQGANIDPKHPLTEMTLLIRTANSELDWAGIIRPLISNLTREVPVTGIRTLPAIVSDAASAPRSTMALFAAFAALALILGTIGIYGVVSYSTHQRTAEIGLRMALGARREDVLGMVLRQGARLVLTGVVIGLIAALGLTRLLNSQLYGVSATDPLVLGPVSLLLTVVAIAACYLPAQRATAVDPLVALRRE